MKIFTFGAPLNVVSAVVSTSDLGMLSILINLASGGHFCQYQGGSMNFNAFPMLNGSVPAHACFLIRPADDASAEEETELVVVAETIQEETLLQGQPFEARTRDQHEYLFVPGAFKYQLDQVAMTFGPPQQAQISSAIASCAEGPQLLPKDEMEALA